MSDLLANVGSSWRVGLALALGFPLLLLVCSEVELRLERLGHPLAGPLRFLRNWVLPAFAVSLFLGDIVGLTSEHVAVRIAWTLFWVASAAMVLSTINGIVFERASPGSWPTRVPRLLRDLVRLLLVAVAAAIVYSYVWGKDLSGGLAALGVSSIVVGLALQEPLGNLFSGVLLLMERPFEVGDRIGVGPVSGVVKEINWRSAHIKGRGGTTQIVPNSHLNKETITNYSRPHRIRRETLEVSFSYDDPPNKVRDVLQEVMRETAGVLADPAPIAATSAYGDSGITYRMIYATADENRWPVRNDVMTRLWYAARRHSLTIPYPVSVNLHYRPREPFSKAAPSTAELLGRFPRLPREATAAGLPGTSVRDYGRDEVVFEAGDVLEGVHLLIEGRVSLRSGDGAHTVEIAAVAPGEFFGEQGLYGTQLADMRAVAVADSTVALLAPDAMRRLFEASPRLARETGRTLDARRRAAQAARASGHSPT